jgi:hypothetical protein
MPSLPIFEEVAKEAEERFSHIQGRMACSCHPSVSILLTDAVVERLRMPRLDELAWTLLGLVRDLRRLVGDHHEHHPLQPDYLTLRRWLHVRTRGTLVERPAEVGTRFGADRVRRSRPLTGADLGGTTCRLATDHGPHVSLPEKQTWAVSPGRTATMNATEITALVVNSASPFGRRNLQQFKQILSRLGKADPQVVAHGLLEVFTRGQPPPEGAPAQELPGRLLVELLPKAEVEA